MASLSSSWLVGTITLVLSATIVVDGVNNAVIPAGTYYLRDATPALSLIDVILAAVTPFMTTPALFAAKDRRLRVTAGASFTWAIPSALEDALGFGASISSTTSATATDISVLLWSPGWCATTIGHPSDTTGWDRSERVHLSSPSGLTQAVVRQGTAATFTSLRWAQVKRARGWSAGQDNGSPGDYRRFFLEVLDPGKRWKRYEVVAEDEASSDPVVWPLAFGPFISPDPKNDWWDRAVANSDTYTHVGLDGMLTSEVT